MRRFSSLALLILLAACGRQPAPAADAGAKDAAVPDLGTLAAPQSAPAIKGLDEAMTLAEKCVTEGRPRRGCLEYDRLREAVIAHSDDGTWQEGLFGRAAGPADANPTRLALTLLADGALPGPAERMIQVLLPLTDATVPFVRAQALRALSPFDGPGVVEKALTLVENDPDGEVREAAAWLIGRPQQARAGKAAITALLRALANDVEPSVKRAAINSIGQLQPPEALPTLIALMDDPLLGPNATLEVGAYTHGTAYRAIISRIAEVKEGKSLPPSTLAALGRLRGHAEYDPAQVRQLLEVVKPFAEKDDTPNGQISVQLLNNHLTRLVAEAAAPPSAPVSAPPSAGK